MAAGIVNVCNIVEPGGGEYIVILPLQSPYILLTVTGIPVTSSTSASSIGDIVLGVKLQSDVKLTSSNVRT